ncbi:MAG: hypothetical protein K2H46_03990 [Muribaculaceae bacterium]|nr:hypothetical protein [Muribaculaceae bacterium]
MLLKRSTIKTHHLLLPALALLGLTACNSDDSSEPTPVKEAPNNGGIALTIPLSSSRTGDDTSPLNSRLTIVAYDAGGHKIETILKNGKFVDDWSGKESDFNRIHKVSDYGTVMSVMLPNDLYGDYAAGKHVDENGEEHHGIQLVAFYLPTESTSIFNSGEDFEAPYDLKDLNSAIKENYILNFPVEDGYWTQADEMLIPMAGALELTSAVKNYDPVLWNENNPMFLNNDPLMLIRTMAKVTIKSEGDFVTEASFKTANHGTLLSENVGSDGKVTQASIPTDDAFMKGFDVFQKYNGEEDHSFVFYTFERDLKDGNNAGLLELTSTLGTKKFDFRPTNDADLNKPEWQGILRNHSYTFTVKKPENSDIQVEVKVKEWEPDRYSVDL